MEIEAAAQALAGEAMPTEEATETTTEDLGAAYDRAMGAGEPEAVEEAAPEVVDEGATEPAETPAEPADEAPTDLPYAVKQKWAEIPKDARDAVVTSQREMSRKLSEATKVAQGLNPIRDSLVRAAGEIPNLAGMRPEQVATEIFELAKISHQFSEKPVETLLGLAKQHGIEPQLRQIFSGQQPTQDTQLVAQLQSEIRGLKGQLSQYVNPEYLREQISTFTRQERVLSEVDAFASQQDHWSDVEQHMPTLIEAVKAKDPGAPAKDVLAGAYELALQLYLPQAKAQAEAAGEATPAADPERTEAALKAKSVNVTSRPSGKTRELTEREKLEAVYDRASKR